MFAHTSRQPFGYTLQHEVAEGVTERVVDDLEAVEVDEEDRQLLSVFFRLFQFLCQAVFEQPTIGQVG
jgi:hypothetical protein